MGLATDYCVKFTALDALREGFETRVMLEGCRGVALRLGVGFKSLLQRETAALITLTDGTRLSAKLAIAADGRASPLREAAGIGVTTTRYGQKALAFSVTHPHPHGNISTEIYNAGGAFTLVPLPDHQGGPASAFASRM